MFEGNRFLPVTGMPMRKNARIIVAFAEVLPEPLTVATTRAKSLTIGGRSATAAVCGALCTSTVLVLILSYLQGNSASLLPVDINNPAFTPGVLSPTPPTQLGHYTTKDAYRAWDLCYKS